MVAKYMPSHDKGICWFCGEPIKNNESTAWFRERDDDDTLIAHPECLNYHNTVEEEEE